MRLLACMLLMALVGLAGCRKSDFYERFVADELRPDIDAVFEAVQARDAEALLDRFGPAARAGDLGVRLQAFLETVPEGAWTQEPEIAGAHRNWTNSTAAGAAETQQLVYVTRTETEHVRIDLVFGRQDGPWQLNYINVYPFEPHPPVGFGVGTMTPQRALALALAAGSFALVVVSIVASFRFHRIKRRILWPLFMLVGYPNFAFDWTAQSWTLVSPGQHDTGNGVTLNLVDIAFFGAGFMDPTPVEPAILTVGVPVGALLFWYRVLRGGPTRKAEPVPA